LKKNEYQYLNNNQTEQVNCKYDFFQAAGNFVTITIYAKNSIPEKTSIQANPIKLEFDVTFEGGQKTFKKSIDLAGVINIKINLNWIEKIF